MYGLTVLSLTDNMHLLRTYVTQMTSKTPYDEAEIIVKKLNILFHFKHSLSFPSNILWVHQ